VGPESGLYNEPSLGDPASRLTRIPALIPDPTRGSFGAPNGVRGLRALFLGEVAKWLGNGLQNRHTPVRIRSSPP
jgi:hypothetical protein